MELKGPRWCLRTTHKWGRDRPLTDVARRLGDSSGTFTPAGNVFDWVNESTEGGMLLFHDHWKIPFTSGHQEHEPSVD